MAKTGFQVDFDGSFKRALKKLGERHKMTAQKIVNQALLDIAEKSFEFTQFPKVNIRDELRQVVADRKFAGLKTAAGTNRIAQTKAEGLAGRTTKKGKFIRHKAARQLMAINLIVNAIRGKSGKKGLSGDAMTRYAAKASRSRTGGRGSLKIAFLPAMRALMPFAKFKFSWATKAKGIKRWPGSSGWGSAKPASKGTSPEAMFRFSRNPKKSNQDGKVLGIYNRAIAKAIAWKRAKTIEKAEKMMAGDLSEFNRR
jgi:hypothetical protein